MAENSKIQWTDHTFNPWIGCTKVHEGCTHCYAEADMDKRRGRVKWGRNGTRSRTSDAYWKQPHKWNCEAEQSGERRRVFCASLADVFEDWQGAIVDARGRTLARLNEGGLKYVQQINEHEPKATMNDLRADLFALIDATPWLDWLLLTKRPENVRRMWIPMSPAATMGIGKNSFRHNVQIGTSISNQPTADKQLPELLKLRDLCPVLFVSAEPLLGPLDLSLEQYESPGWYEDRGRLIDWIIVGGESGHGARPMQLEWARSIVQQCKAASVPVFVKQLGAAPQEMRQDPTYACEHEEERTLHLIDRKGGDMAEWPADLRVREYPEVQRA